MNPSLNRLWVFVAVSLALNFVALGSRALSAQDTSGMRKITQKVTPQYPPLCRTLKISGSVKVDALVAPNGTVKSVEVKGGHPVLAEAAQNAVRQWKWEPSSHESHETVELRFNP